LPEKKCRFPVSKAKEIGNFKLGRTLSVILERGTEMENKMNQNAYQPTRIAIVGAGNVGATFAYALLQSGLAGEIVLIDRNQTRAEGEVRGLQRYCQGGSHRHHCRKRPKTG
jgi:FlaA1/EpsC-like NDP-sugar epimerase